MKGSLIALDVIDGAKAAALVIDGKLNDLVIDAPAGGAPPPGTIFRAIADRPMKGMGGGIVRLPDGETGFLRTKDGLRAGQKMLVQVTGFAEPGKAVPVTSKLLFKGRFAILTPGAPGVNISRKVADETLRGELFDLAAQVDLGPCGAILRSNAAQADPDQLMEELQALANVSTAILGDTDTNAALLLDGPDAHNLARRDWDAPDQWDDNPGAFARHGIAEMIDTIRRAKTDLPGGASAWIEATRALIAIDVNTGKDFSAAAGLKANIALAQDLPRQLRCRGMGGQITIDFAPMPKRDRKQVEQTLRSAFRADPIETALVGWTPLGHFELQRKRDRFPLF